MGQLLGANIPASPYFNALQQGIGRSLGMGGQTGTQYPLGSMLYGRPQVPPAWTNSWATNQPATSWIPPRTQVPGYVPSSSFGNVGYQAPPPATAQAPGTGGAPAGPGVPAVPGTTQGITKSDFLASQAMNPYWGPNG